MSAFRRCSFFLVWFFRLAPLVPRRVYSVVVVVVVFIYDGSNFDFKEKHNRIEEEQKKRKIKKIINLSY